MVERRRRIVIAVIAIYGILKCLCDCFVQGIGIMYQNRGSYSEMNDEPKLKQVDPK